MKNAINERITAYRVVLIAADGTNRGEILKSAALEIAKKDGLDLVEVSAGTIPVCKIMDYGKIQYEKQKSEKHKSHPPSMKEMRFEYMIEQHDLDIKKRKITEFLTKGHKVVVSMKVAGRERYVGRGAAKEKFTNFIKLFNPNIKISDISENEKGYNTVVSPSMLVSGK